MRYPYLVLVLVAGILAGCRSETEPIVADFPSERAFLFSTSIRMVAFGGELSCIDVIDRIESNETADAVYDSELVPKCDFFAGMVEFPSLPDEQLSIGILAFERDNSSVMLQGCRTLNPQDRIETGEAIAVPLQTTAYFNANYNTETPDCVTAEAQCNGECN